MESPHCSFIFPLNSGNNITKRSHVLFLPRIACVPDPLYISQMILDKPSLLNFSFYIYNFNDYIF